MFTFEKLKEECAVFGVSVNSLEAAAITYNGLLALQHRGQEGSGIAVMSDNRILYHKNVGLVSEVFTGDVIERLPKSNLAIGHNRYSTTGSNTKENAAPFIIEFLTGRIAVSHNGNITNANEIKSQLQKHGIKFSATSDSEVVSSLIAYHCTISGDTVQGVINACKLIKGAFSLIVMTHENKLIAVRDPYGYRPLCYGESQNGIAIASESCAMDSCGFETKGDIAPGEIVVIEDGKIQSREILLSKDNEPGGLCIFEYVYFARPDSIFDNLSVYEARFNMGRMLAKEHPVEADVVCGVPDSGLEAAEGYSAQSGIPLKSGFMKNRYIGRSFIYPTQAQRENAVRLKLNPLRTNVEGKRVVLVDDSIVRGTTSAKIIQNLKNAGAKEVHMRISSPPFKFTCHYGTDIDNEENLIANKMSVDEIAKSINADSLGYISLGGLFKSCEKCNTAFCSNCFDGSHSHISLKKDDLE